MAYEVQLNVLLIFFLHHDVFCDLLGYRPMATWDLFVLYDRKKQYFVYGDVIFASVLQ